MGSKRRPRREAVHQIEPSWLSRFGPQVAAAASIVVTSVIRWRLAGVPLERDEGEYAYAGQLILDGVAPYSLAYNMKFPGTYYGYATLMALFGQSTRGIRIGLLVLAALSTWGLFLVARRLIGGTGAGVAAVVFATLALDRWSMAFFGHATHFVVLPVVFGVLLLLRARESGRLAWYVAGGAAFGLAVLMKQHAVLLVPLAAGLAVQRPDNGTGGSVLLRAIAAVLAGLAAPLVLVLLVLAWHGVLDRFWFWTIQYSAQYVTEVGASEGLALLGYGWGEVTRATGWIWLAAALGLCALWMTRWPATVRVALTAWLALAAAAVLPGLYFRPHYFIVVLPVVALLAGVLVQSVGRAMWPTRQSAVAAILTLALVLPYGLRERQFLFAMDGDAISRSVYDVNPFVESPVIARHIRERTTPTDRIAVLGSEPQIYFLSGRKSATGHIYTYPLMEPQPFASQMQADMIREIEDAQPAFVVVVIVPGSWAAQPTSDDRILRWMDRYTRACYTISGIAEITPARTVWRWDSEAAGQEARTPQFVAVHRRKPGGPCRSQ